MANSNLTCFTFTLLFWISCAHNVRSPSRSQVLPTFSEPNTLSLTIPVNNNENITNIESDLTASEFFPIEMESIDAHNTDSSDDYVPESTEEPHQAGGREYNSEGKGHHGAKPERASHTMTFVGIASSTLSPYAIGFIVFFFLFMIIRVCQRQAQMQRRRAQVLVQPNLAAQPAYVPPPRSDQYPAQYYAPPGQGYEAVNPNQGNAPAQYAVLPDEERARQTQNQGNQGQYGQSYYS